VFCLKLFCYQQIYQAPRVSGKLVNSSAGLILLSYFKFKTADEPVMNLITREMKMVPSLWVQMILASALGSSQFSELSVIATADFQHHIHLVLDTAQQWHVACSGLTCSNSSAALHCMVKSLTSVQWCHLCTISLWLAFHSWYLLLVIDVMKL
jgi:hypothetical protein